jgi:hypothetical protein
MNTGMDIIDQLGKKLMSVEEKVTPIVKDVKVDKAKASNASNTISTLSKTVDGLVRKVAALESKNRMEPVCLQDLLTPKQMTALGLNLLHWF